MKSKSQVSELLQQQKVLKHETEDFNTMLAVKDLEITRLKALLQKEQSQGPGPSTCGKEDVEALKAHNA